MEQGAKGASWDKKREGKEVKGRRGSAKSKVAESAPWRRSHFIKCDARGNYLCTSFNASARRRQNETGRKERTREPTLGQDKCDRREAERKRDACLGE